MSSLSDIYLKIETVETLLKTMKAKQLKGIGITVSITDETNQYGQNINAYVSQTKEQREAKQNRFYVGNGKCFWTDGKITVAEKQASNEPAGLPPSDDFETDDLPF